MLVSPFGGIVVGKAVMWFSANKRQSDKEKLVKRSSAGFMQRRLVFRYRTFGSTCRSDPQGPGFNLTIRLTRSSATFKTNRQFKPRNVVHRGGRLKSRQNFPCL
jgi:hypothetical protein